MFLSRRVAAGVFKTIACLSALSGIPTDCAGQAIALVNYQPGETVRYPLVLLRGTLEDKALDGLTVVNQSSHMDSRELRGQACMGRFKALAELVPGENLLVLKAGAASLNVNIHYKPQTNPYKVRAVHFTDKTGSPTFESPFSDDPQDYRAKFDAALKLMQTFTADEMHRLGYGRQTFNLELDEDGKVIVHVVKGSGTFDELQALRGGTVYGAAARAAESQLPSGPYKDLVNVAFSRLLPGTGQATAYAALGGGDMALMGGACFYTWPTGVTQIHKVFMSDTQIDPQISHADDNGRFAVWATASTTIGSGLHELGHTFTLPHTRYYPNGIMRRGGDTLNRYLTFFDPPSRNHPDFRVFGSEPEPCWSDVCGAALAASRWFAMDAREYTRENTIRFALDPGTAELVVRSDDGLAFACVEIPGEAERFDPKANPTALPQELRMSLAGIAETFQTSQLTVRAMDGMGHYRHTFLKGLLDREQNRTTDRPVSASQPASADFPPSAAVDGNKGSYWDASPYPQWLQVDLEQPTLLEEVHLHAYVGDNRYYQYTIEISTDGAQWLPIVNASENRNPSVHEGYRHTFEPVLVRYLRVNMLKNSLNPGVHISELHVFGPGDPRQPHDPAYSKLKTLFK